MSTNRNRTIVAGLVLAFHGGIASAQDCPGGGASPSPSVEEVVRAVSAAASTARGSSTTITRDGRYIYYRTPWADLADAQKRAVWRESLEVLRGELVGALPDRLESAAALRDFQTRFPTFDPLLAELESLNDTDRSRARLPRDLVPTAILCQIGGKGSLNVGYGAGAGGGLGAIVVPSYVEKVDPLTGRVVDKGLEYRVGFYSLVDASAGIGGGGGARAFGGCGLVWGRLDKPEEFRGVAAGLSGTAALPVGGLNLKLMALNRLGSEAWVDNVFVMAHYMAGAVAEASIHGTVKLIMNPGTILSSLMTGLDGDELKAGRVVRRPVE